MELIDKSAVVAEIERRIKELEPFKTEDNLRAHGAIAGYYQILSFIRSLEVKEVDLDLEKEIDNIWNPRFNLGWDEKSLLSMNHEGFTTIAKHFYELGLKVQKDLTLSNYDKAMITTITNALNYLEELNDSKGHDNVPSQYQSEKDWLKSLKRRKENKHVITKNIL